MSVGEELYQLQFPLAKTYEENCGCGMLVEKKKKICQGSTKAVFYLWVRQGLEMEIEIRA